MLNKTNENLDSSVFIKLFISFAASSLLLILLLILFINDTTAQYKYISINLLIQNNGYNEFLHPHLQVHIVTSAISAWLFNENNR